MMMMMMFDPQQRLQVVVRGQRFESTLEIVSAYCVLFRCFFREAFAKARETGNVSSSSSSDVDWKMCYDTAASEASAALPQDAEDGTRVAAASVGWDSESGMWRFVYTDANLSPEEVGVVFVYIRKLFRWNSSRGQAQVPQRNPPQLPIRWDEMPHDLQLAMARVIRTFGVTSLMERYGRPTAPPPGDGNTNGASNSEDTATASRWEKAERYLQQRMMRVQPAGVMLDAADNGVHPSVEDDDLLLAAAACSRCGVTGHVDSNCPR